MTPRLAAKTRTKTTAAPAGTPASSKSGSEVATRAMTEPMERSIPAVTMGNAAPMPMIPKSAVRWRTFSRFSAPKKRGFMAPVVTTIATRSPKIPSTLPHPARGELASECAALALPDSVMSSLPLSESRRRWRAP